jgi:hypothetical protein
MFGVTRRNRAKPRVGNQLADMARLCSTVPGTVSAALITDISRHLAGGESAVKTLDA